MNSSHRHGVAAEPVVLVSGPRGLLGATLLQTPVANHEVIGFAVDIRDSQAVFAEVEMRRPTLIIHTAAKTDVAECERDPEQAQAVNTTGTKNVVDAARAIGARVIYISTVSVFDGKKGNYTESDTPAPVNVYNTTKREGELKVLAYEKGMVLRLNLIGVHPNGSRVKNFLEWLIDSIRANKDLSLFSDQLVNPLSNWTVAKLIAEIVQEDIREKILHIGSCDPLSKAAIGKLVLARFPEYRGTVVEKSVGSIADGVVRPKEMWLNTERVTTLLGAMPTIAQELDAVFLKPPFGNQ